MKVLIGIPHIFSPKKDSVYSSESESKRKLKTNALALATEGNRIRHQREHWIHASLGFRKQITTRALTSPMGVDLTFQVYTDLRKSLAVNLIENKAINIVNIELEDAKQMPMVASRSIIEQAHEYDMICYMEDDLVIEDTEFFQKIHYLINGSGGSLSFLPHRCETIPGRGDVILSGDPDGGRPDLFWDTGEKITIPWPLGDKQFYRATNPHSGCYFLTQHQALKLRDYWTEKNWVSDFTLSGPLEQAASGLLLPVFKIMKPVPEHYRFLMVRHQDNLWQRHSFETTTLGK